MYHISRHITTIIASFCIMQMSAQSKQIQPRRALGIINGARTDPHEYPYLVAIMDRSMITLAGGGTLISRLHVLTAAHVARLNVSGVILGAQELFNRSRYQIFVRVEEQPISHPDHNYVLMKCDIAILKLINPVTFNDDIRIVHLPSMNDKDKNYTNSVATAIGWGHIEYNGKTGTFTRSTTLRKMEVNITSFHRCYQELEFPSEETDETEICGIGIASRSTCKGDSGGPLIFEGVQIGIIFRGDPMCRINRAELFTNVGKYLEWIQPYYNVQIIN